MTRSRLKKEYFEWMCNKVYDKKYCKNKSYQKLLTLLNKIEFYCIIPMDVNRADDGISLRYRFAYDNGYDYSMIDLYFGDSPCSVLEMMVALATRCEEDIMSNTELDTSVGTWFWKMIINLDLYSVTDDDFDESYVNYRIDILLNREYERNGEGGLFTVKYARKDLRIVEIWYQMNWYLDEILRI